MNPLHIFRIMTGQLLKIFQDYKKEIAPKTFLHGQHCYQSNICHYANTAITNQEPVYYFNGIKLHQCVI